MMEDKESVDIEPRRLPWVSDEDIEAVENELTAMEEKYK